MKKGSVGFKAENLTAPDIPSTWKAMEALYDSGKARAIGVSNFSKKKLGDLLDVARVRPAVNQVECHPSWQQAKLHEFCKSKGVHLSGYSPLGSPGTTWLKSDVLKHPTLNMVAEKLGKTPAQARLLRGSSFVHERFGGYKTLEELWDDNILYSGEDLSSGSSLDYGSYIFKMQEDCNLVLYEDNNAVWASGTNGGARNCYCSMQYDGNLVIYESENKSPIWASGTDQGTGNYVLVLQKDRNVVIYGSALWATNTHIVVDAKNISTFISVI
ncbi:hypothetical protein F0562_016677 [Nyssa sinensis]|uniref:Bulb-type lectin domain-containing protein n=1 Tax=Nyssa sinensis TaxID=561372 RepID=A0A5J4ZEZ3_9ASTE|nr:hypothetical protein F0562_016677 [Nyssa sinensis]